MVLSVSRLPSRSQSPLSYRHWSLCWVGTRMRMLIAPRCETGARYPHPICVCGEFGQSPNTPSVWPLLKRNGKEITHVSLNNLTAFLVSSSRSESTPYDRLDERKRFLSSDLCSGFTLRTKKAKGEAENVRRGRVNTYQRTTTTHRSTDNVYEIHLTTRILFWSISRRSTLSRSTDTILSVEFSMLSLSSRVSM